MNNSDNNNNTMTLEEDRECLKHKNESILSKIKEEEGLESGFEGLKDVARDLSD